MDGLYFECARLKLLSIHDLSDSTLQGPGAHDFIYSRYYLISPQEHGVVCLWCRYIAWVLAREHGHRRSWHRYGQMVPSHTRVRICLTCVVSVMRNDRQCWYKLRGLNSTVHCVGYQACSCNPFYQSISVHKRAANSCSQFRIRNGSSLFQWSRKKPTTN